jgi:hypothetical protein
MASSICLLFRFEVAACAEASVPSLYKGAAFGDGEWCVRRVTNILIFTTRSFVISSVQLCEYNFGKL